MKSSLPGWLRTESRRAFSLMEMLVTLALIGVLSAILAGGMRSVTENGRRLKCTSQLRQISEAISLYRAENNNTYPPANPWNAETGDAGWLAWYTGDPKFGKDSPLAAYVGGVETMRKLSVCPSNSTKFAGPVPDKIRNTYGYPYTVNYNIMVDSLSAGKTAKNASLVSRPASTVLMADSAASSAAWGLGFADTGWASFQRIAKRHGEKSNLLWCDGHVTLQSPATIDNKNLYP